MLYSNRNRPLTVRCFRGVIAGSADVCNHARNVITVISLANPLPEKEKETCNRRGVFEKITRWNLCQNSYLNFFKNLASLINRLENGRILSNPRGDKTTFIHERIYRARFSAIIPRALIARELRLTGYSEILRATLVIAAVNNSGTNNSPQNSRHLLTRCVLFFPGNTLHDCSEQRDRSAGSLLNS